MWEVQDRIQRLLEHLTETGQETGLQVACYLDGELIVDAWAGLADEATGRPVDGDTLFSVASATKGVTATCIHILADRGVVDYDTPVAWYWPEFGAHGKDRITIRHVLTHQAGVPQMPDGVTPKMLCDWDAMCAAIADFAPLWEPGTKTGYHAFTFGWMLGEVVQRADGRAIAQFVQQEVCQPLGIADLYFGIPDRVESRVATLYEEPRPIGTPIPRADSLHARATALVGGAGGADLFNRLDVRRAVLPAVGGIMNARALAQHYALLAGGGQLNGVQVLSADRVRMASRLQTAAVDEVFGVPMRKALGYMRRGPLNPMGPWRTAFGHAGSGGTVGFADVERRFAFALTKNLRKISGLREDSTAATVAGTVWTLLGFDRQD